MQDLEGLKCVGTRGMRRQDRPVFREGSGSPWQATAHEEAPWKKRAVLVGLAVLVTFASLVGCGGADDPPLAKVREPVGEVEARLKAGEGFASVQGEQPLKEGGGVRTGRASGARIAFADGSEAVVKAEAYFEVHAKVPRALQEKGLVIYRFNKQQQETRIKTPHGLTAVLGTMFLLEVDADSTTLVVEEGRVSFTDLMGTTVEVGAGQRVIARRGSPVTPPAAVDPFERESLFKDVPFESLKLNRQ